MTSALIRRGTPVRAELRSSRVRTDWPRAAVPDESPLVMVSSACVGIDVAVFPGVVVDDRLPEPRDLVHQLVVDGLADVVGGFHGEVRIDGHPNGRVQIVANPADADGRDVLDAVHVTGNGL